MQGRWCEEGEEGDGQRRGGHRRRVVVREELCSWPNKANADRVPVKQMMRSGPVEGPVVRWTDAKKEGERAGGGGRVLLDRVVASFYTPIKPTPFHAISLSVLVSRTPSMKTAQRPSDQALKAMCLGPSERDGESESLQLAPPDDLNSQSQPFHPCGTRAHQL